MAKDKAGADLNVGDTVTVTCKVEKNTDKEKGSNVTLRVVAPEGSTEHAPVFALNGGLCEKVESGD